MTKTIFATPLPQSSHSEVLEWHFPGRFKHLVLTGKSRAAWHTSFVVPQLNLLLDAGLIVNNQRPKHIFLTHGHSDHVLLTPAFIKRSDPPDIFCPAEITQVLDDYLIAKTVLNKGGLKTRTSDEDDPSETTSVDGDVEDDEDLNDSVAQSNPQAQVPAKLSTTSASATAPIPPTNNKKRHWLSTHDTYGLRPGDVVPLRRTVDFTAEAFACDHTVPSLGYIFKFNSNKLKQEYIGLPGPELKALRESGVEITAPLAVPVFAFLGDTTAATLAAEPQWLRNGIPVIITECSFLWEEHRAQATKTKHTIWADLEPVVRKWPKTTFILMHFSLRYSDGDIRRFFAEMQDPPPNIVVWVDGDPEPAQ